MKFFAQSTSDDCTENHRADGAAAAEPGPARVSAAAHRILSWRRRRTHNGRRAAFSQATCESRTAGEVGGGRGVS